MPLATLNNQQFYKLPPSGYRAPEAAGLLGATCPSPCGPPEPGSGVRLVTFSSGYRAPEAAGLLGASCPSPCGPPEPGSGVRICFRANSSNRALTLNASTKYREPPNRAALCIWWRRRGSNPRPKTISLWHYMFSPFKQHPKETERTKCPRGRFVTV